MSYLQVLWLKSSLNFLFLPCRSCLCLSCPPPCDHPNMVKSANFVLLIVLLSLFHSDSWAQIFSSAPPTYVLLLWRLSFTHIYKTGKIIVIWFMVYSSPSRQMQRYYLKSGHYSFLAWPFHLSIHWFYHLMLYKPWINNIIVTFLHCWYNC
jgi:hypothetical protein